MPAPSMRMLPPRETLTEGEILAPAEDEEDPASSAMDVDPHDVSGTQQNNNNNNNDNDDDDDDDEDAVDRMQRKVAAAKRERERMRQNSDFIPLSSDAVSAIVCPPLLAFPCSVCPLLHTHKQSPFCRPDHRCTARTRGFGSSFL